ncbi:hypothetical protein LWI28_015801 [Acer negundo]|uniref:Uncharacterized protein n=1 Tax=Acer negundo TaxID=4023 RepID=A0AAD5NEW1_ACENE|nr:hypothetical protein LWI28_015801 [Acer negundo]
MLCDLDEPEEQTIAHYLGGLQTKICNTVQLQQYWSFNDVVKISLKVEKQLKENRNGGTKSWFKYSIAKECPNRKIISLVKEVDKEALDENWQSEDEGPKFDEEITYGDQGESLVIRRSLNTTYAAADNWL